MHAHVRGALSRVSGVGVTSSDGINDPGGEKNMALIGNKCDLEHDRQIDAHEAATAARAKHCYHFETSAVDKGSVEDEFSRFFAKIYGLEQKLEQLKATPKSKIEKCKNLVRGLSSEGRKMQRQSSLDATTADAPRRNSKQSVFDRQSSVDSGYDDHLPNDERRSSSPNQFVCRMVEKCRLTSSARRNSLSHDRRESPLVVTERRQSMPTQQLRKPAQKGVSSEQRRETSLSSENTPRVSSECRSSSVSSEKRLMAVTPRRASMSPDFGSVLTSEQRMLATGSDRRQSFSLQQRISISSDNKRMSPLSERRASTSSESGLSVSSERRMSTSSLSSESQLSTSIDHKSSVDDQSRLEDKQVRTCEVM